MGGRTDRQMRRSTLPAAKGQPLNRRGGAGGNRHFEVLVIKTIRKGGSGRRGAPDPRVCPVPADGSDHTGSPSGPARPSVRSWDRGRVGRRPPRGLGRGSRRAQQRRTVFWPGRETGLQT